MSDPLPMRHLCDFPAAPCRCAEIMATVEGEPAPVTILPPCPWCGDEPQDPDFAWTTMTGKGGDALVTACASCGWPIRITRVVTVSYTVEQVEER